MPSQGKTPETLLGYRQPDARRNVHEILANLIASGKPEGRLTAHKIDAVHASIDAPLAAELTRTIRPRRPDCANQHCTWLPLRLSHDIEAVVHTIYEVDIRVSAGAEHNLASPGFTPKGI